ncbi:MAG: coproporphyrinogen III oxidase, partial [Prolixibacteraceae bacterium]|nr:coproporphyrinogen III oxidase [Prolixibacteraceae bacterium]
ILEVKGLPRANEKLEMFEAGFKLLTENGYTAIGLDHYAKATDELSIALKNRTLHRNFQGYCTRETTGQVYAFGASGISQLENAYAQNTKDTNRYIELINKGKLTTEKGYRLNRAEKVVRHIIAEIMCNYFVSLSETARHFNLSINEVKNIVNYNEERLSNFVSDKLLTFNAEEIAVSDLGKFFVRNIAACLDPEMKTATKKFSKAL